MRAHYPTHSEAGQGPSAQTPEARATQLPAPSAGLGGEGLPQVFHLPKPLTSEPSSSPEPRMEKKVHVRVTICNPMEQLNRGPVSGENTFHFKLCQAQKPEAQPSRKQELGGFQRRGGRGREPGSGGRELQAVPDKPPAAQRGIWAPLTQPAQPAALRKTQATVRGDHWALPGSYLRRVRGAASPGLWGAQPRVRTLKGQNHLAHQAPQVHRGGQPPRSSARGSKSLHLSPWEG